MSAKSSRRRLGPGYELQIKFGTLEIGDFRSMENAPVAYRTLHIVDSTHLWSPLPPTTTLATHNEEHEHSSNNIDKSNESANFTTEVPWLLCNAVLIMDGKVDRILHRAGDHCYELVLLPRLEIRVLCFSVLSMPVD